MKTKTIKFILFCFLLTFNCFSQENKLESENDFMKLTTIWKEIICKDGKSEINSFVEGGVEPYVFTYFKLNGFSNDTIQSDYKSKINVGPGYYRVRVTDAKGKTIETKIENKKWSWIEIIDTNKYLKPIYDITYPSNKNSNNGKIHILEVENAKLPVTYKCNDEFVNSRIKKLEAGNYNITIIDSNNCKITDTIKLKNYKKSITKVNKALVLDSTINEKDTVLGLIYPNPPNNINPSKIEYIVPKNTLSKIIIYNSNGFLVASFDLNPDDYYIEIYNRDLTVGQYYYVLYVENIFVDRKSFIIFKN